jgi:hypothetical protein
MNLACLVSPVTGNLGTGTDNLGIRKHCWWMPLAPLGARFITVLCAIQDCVVSPTTNQPWLGKKPIDAITYREVAKPFSCQNDPAIRGEQQFVPRMYEPRSRDCAVLSGHRCLPCEIRISAQQGVSLREIHGRTNPFHVFAAKPYWMWRCSTAIAADQLVGMKSVRSVNVVGEVPEVRKASSIDASPCLKRIRK